MSSANRPLKVTRYIRASRAIVERCIENENGASQLILLTKHSRVSIYSYFQFQIIRQISFHFHNISAFSNWWNLKIIIRHELSTDLPFFFFYSLFLILIIRTKPVRLYIYLSIIKIRLMKNSNPSVIWHHKRS